MSHRNQNTEPIEVVEVVDVEQAKREFTLEDYREVLKRESVARLESHIKTGACLDSIVALKYEEGVKAGLEFAMQLTTPYLSDPVFGVAPFNKRAHTHPVKEGLTPGRIVHYVLDNGEHRAAIVVDVAHPGDDVSLTMVSQGLATLNVFSLKGDKPLADQDGYVHCFYSDKFARCTWHWIEKV